MTVLRGRWHAVDGMRLELGEGARFVDGRFVLVDLLRGRLFGTDGSAHGGLTAILEYDEPLGAVAPRREGWIAAVGDGVELVDAAGQPRRLARPLAERAAESRVNDAVADAAGRFWVGIMPYDGSPRAGCLVRVDPDGSTHLALDGLTIPNGPALSADGTRLFLADTPTGWIRSYPLDPATGALGEPADFAYVEAGGPDGMTMDSEGCLWVAVWGASCLHRYSPDGHLLEVIDVPAAQPTSIALSSTPPFRVVVTTATFGLTAPERDDGRVLTAEVRVGAPDAQRYGG